MARTDALAVEGIDKAIERAVKCVEAGADMIFPEAMTDLAMYKKFKAAVKVPILANITEFGHTPLFTTAELASADVDIVLFCCSAYRAMNAALKLCRIPATAAKNRGRVCNARRLLQYLHYHAYEQKLDSLFLRQRKIPMSATPNAET